jgi:hypothetical protein
MRLENNILTWTNAVDLMLKSLKLELLCITFSTDFGNSYICMKSTQQLYHEGICIIRLCFK